MLKKKKSKSYTSMMLIFILNANVLILEIRLHEFTCIPLIDQEKNDEKICMITGLKKTPKT